MSEKKYNLTVAALWATAGGNYRSMDVDDKVFDAIQAVEKGGRFLLKIVNEENRTSEKSPHAYIEYITKEDNDAFKAKLASGKGGGFKKAAKVEPADDADDI